jgi:competence protein ComEC
VSIIATLGLVIATATAPLPPPVPGDLTVYVLNVGQGDAILIVCPFGTHRMLIDTGAGDYPGSQDAFRALLRELVPEGETIDVVVATHPHADHVGGLHWVLSTYRVRKFIDNGKPYTSTYADVRTLANSLVQAHKLKYFAADKFPPPSVADFCTDPGVKAELLIPDGFGEAKNMNDNSVAVLVRHKGVKLLFTGDAQKAEERLLTEDPVVAQKLSGAVFYKLGHHGAETSTTDALLGRLDLHLAAVSSGCKGIHPNKGYRHPRAAVLQRVQQAMAPLPDRSPTMTANAGLTQKGKWTTVKLTEEVYATGVDGTVRIGSDGTAVRRVAGAPASPLGTCN